MAKGMRTAKKLRKLVERYRVEDGGRFRLSEVDPADLGGLGREAQEEADELLARGIRRLAEAQERLYAQDRRSLLLIFQAMDAAGKDGTIAHVMSGVNPQGCQVCSFKQPSAEELDHDFMWRCVRQLPERGRIGIFNRSYYEEVLVVRVHREILDAQRLPRECVHDGIFKERLEDIGAFERYLARNGTTILKFFLHVSREEQKRRFLERLDQPEKNWKFSPRDVAERRFRKPYLEAYEKAIRATATEHAPWIVVPADHKWFTRLVVAETIAQTLDAMHLGFPKLDPARRRELAAARRELMSEKRD